LDWFRNHQELFFKKVRQFRKKEIKSLIFFYQLFTKI